MAHSPCALSLNKVLAPRATYTKSAPRDTAIPHSCDPASGQARGMPSLVNAWGSGASKEPESQRMGSHGVLVEQRARPHGDKKLSSCAPLTSTNPTNQPNTSFLVRTRYRCKHANQHDSNAFTHDFAKSLYSCGTPGAHIHAPRAHARARAREPPPVAPDADAWRARLWISFGAQNRSAPPAQDLNLLRHCCKWWRWRWHRRSPK